MAEKSPLGRSPEPGAERDAVHCAIIPTVAAMTLQPGQHVGLDEMRRANADRLPHVGIVDPFLATTVTEGSAFYLLLYPNTVTGMRHHWLHPAFVDTTDEAKLASKQWIEAWCESMGIEYDRTMDAAAEYLDYGDYWIEGGRFEGEGVPGEFWNHYQIVTGRFVGENERGSFFSCSC